MASVRKRIYLKMSTDERRYLALEQAIKANAGHAYDDEGRSVTDADKIVEAAKKFEAYLKEKAND